MKAEDTAFWDFSLRFYGGPGVSDALIALQDRRGRDVNLLLYAIWLGLSGRGLADSAALERVASILDPWRRRVIEPLRAARRALKAEGASLAALYAAVKSSELAAERVAQLRLAAQAPQARTADGAARAAAAAANLRLALAGTDPAETAAIFTAIENWQEEGE
jgi:uncharacterized protein (TIGR02444 family)